MANAVWGQAEKSHWIADGSNKEQLKNILQVQ